MQNGLQINHTWVTGWITDWSWISHVKVTDSYIWVSDGSQMNRKWVSDESQMGHIWVAHWSNFQIQHFLSSSPNLPISDPHHNPATLRIEKWMQFSTDQKKLITLLWHVTSWFFAYRVAIVRDTLNGPNFGTNFQKTNSIKISENFEYRLINSPKLLD